MNRIMVLKGGSPAIHKLGDIGREEDDFIRVHREEGENFIGAFEEGFGFIDVKFRKENCRPINEDEYNRLNGCRQQIGSIITNPMEIDRDGNIIPKIKEEHI